MFGMKKGGGFDNRYKGGKLKNAIYVIVVLIAALYFMATESEGSAIILSANILL